MIFNPRIMRVANAARKEIQRHTKTVDDGESVSIAVWWSFICDHARCMNKDPKQLAIDQLGAFLAAEPIKMERGH